MTRTHRGEEGFTLVEVVIAVAIFFVVFSAVMSLMLSVINTNVEAKAKTTLTNAASTYVERVRAMNYHQIGTPAAPPYGSLDTTTTVVNGYTLTIAPTITWVDDPTISGAQNYKKLVINVSGSRSGGTVQRYTVETIIKQPDTGTNPNAIPPTIDFTASSPADNGRTQGVVNVGAVASANGTNVTLTSMTFYCDGVALQNSYGNTAQWPLNTTASTQTFNWDTEANNEDGVPLSIDGWHILKVECWDSNGKRAADQRMVLVDNEPPNPPTSLVVANTGANLLSLTWNASTDGNTTADHYIVSTWQQTIGAEGTTSKADWNGPTEANSTATNIVVTPAAFSRYAFQVVASNPTGSMLSTPVERFGVSRPSLTGTWTNHVLRDARNDRNDAYTSTHSFTLSTPTFPCTVTNTLYRSTSSAMTSAVALSSGSGYTYTYTTPTSYGTATQYYYQVRSVVSPRGYNGLDAGGNPIPNAPITLYSNVIGPNAATGGGTGPLAHVRW